MKFIILFFFAILTNLGTLATANTLPILSEKNFSVGKYWIWVYYEMGDFNRPYSYEKYVVEEVQGQQITFTLRSKFPGQTEFQAQQKFQVDLQKCHKAYADPALRKNWTLKSYYRSGEEWVSLGVSSKTAIFEEKFNCNPHLFQNHHRYTTHFKDYPHPKFGDVTLFGQGDKVSKIPLSWYIQDPDSNLSEIQGVTLLKEFHPGTSHSYLMRLEEWGMAGFNSATF